MTRRSPRISYNSHALRVLEFDRIRDIVALLADSAEGRSRLAGLEPSGDTEVARELLVEADELMQALLFDDAPPGMGVLDIREIFQQLKVKGYTLDIETIAAVAGNLETARIVREFFEERTEKYPTVWGIAQDITAHEDIEARIRKAITPDLTIADNASSELKSIRRRLAHARADLRDLVEKTLRSLPDDIVAERLVTVRNNRFVIPVRDSMKRRVPGAVHDRSQTGKTLFIEPMTSIEGNNLVCELEMAEHAEIHRILAELSSLIASISGGLRRNQDTIVRIDTIMARARYGVRVDGVVPELNDRPALSIRKGRHPLLDWKIRKQDDGSVVVPLDVDIGDDHVTIVITGPNAGGKTVALKTIGLLTAMALSGLPVPAAGGTAVYAPNGIFADIGDEQSIENDLSTFSSHMRQIVTLLREAGAGSLVLLDELGGGTNPADGEAIALAVLKNLTGVRALSVVTTHHDGLKVFAHDTDGAVNASMEFDNEILKPTFAFRMGIPGSSYAFEIAGRIGMPKNVLREAESIAGGDRKSLEGLIADMEEHLREADEERKAAEEERLKLTAVREDYERRRDDIAERKNELLGEAITESKKLLADVNRRIESSVREIRETKAAHDAIVEAKAARTEIKKKLDRISKRIQKKKKTVVRNPVTDIRQGLDVWVESLASPAVVESVLDNGRKARIRVGTSKASIVVSKDDLYEADADSKRPKQRVQVNVRSSAITSNEIDLRGMTFEEARDTLELFLDQLYVKGIDTAHVIHGKGTGALRSKLGRYFEKHPNVESARLGNWNEGSSGVTVVTLKK